MHTPYLTRALFGAVAAILGFASLSCDALDPVKTQSLCEDRLEVSMRCPQCQTIPYAAECSFCVRNLAARSDPLMCEQSIDPGTDPDSGGPSKPDGSDNPGESGTTGDAGGGRGGAGASGAGKGGQSGGGKSGAGGAGGTAGSESPSLTCDGDLWCSSRTPERPACDLNAKACVPCTMDKHCTGMFPVCNTAIHRCQNCVDDPDCGGGRQCDKQNMVCVDCIDDKNCTDSVKNQCDTRVHSCVDCVTDAGCMDQTVNRTCDPSTYTCIDCMDDGDCNEMGKPACDKPNRTCVGCLNDSYCAGVNGSCDTENHVCVDCTTDDGCGGTTPRCNQDAKKCVACLEDVDCPSGHCFEEGQTCVECEADEDCDDPAAAHCDSSSHRCVGCTSSTHCGHLSETRACDTTARRCVECNDDTTCSGNACIRSTHECSDVPVGSLSTCEACKADSMCGTNMKCIPMSFDGKSYGTFCAFTQSSRGRCSNARPYSQASSVRSVDGSSQSYCVPPASTTCQGVLDLTTPFGGKNCAGTNECGLGMGDGICNAARRCTYGCADDVDCPAGLTCLTGLNCGG